MRMLLARGRLDGAVFLREDSVAQMLRQSWRAEATGSNGRSDFGSQRALSCPGLGNQHFLDVSGTTAVTVWSLTVDFALWGIWGCLGLTAAFVFDAGSGNGLVHLIGGPGFDPTTYRGKYSAFCATRRTNTGRTVPSGDIAPVVGPRDQSRDVAASRTVTVAACGLTVASAPTGRVYWCVM